MADAVTDRQHDGRAGGKGSNQDGKEIKGEFFTGHGGALCGSDINDKDSGYSTAIQWEGGRAVNHLDRGSDAQNKQAA
jgi:hypothetical protein